MSFVQSLTGLYGASLGLDAIGNNLANASTAGFKNGRSEFSDFFATYMASRDVGLGGSAPTVVQQFQQGDITTSGNMLDFSINGNGFFQVSSDAAATQRLAYTRNGEFHFAPVSTAAGTSATDRYIVNANGNYLMGWGAGVATTATPTVLTINSEMAAAATSTSQIRVNLDDRTDVRGSVPFSTTDPNSFNWSTSQTVYSGVDDDVTAHELTLYFVKTATPNVWTVHTRIDGNIPAEEAAGGRSITFSSAGLLSAGGTLTSSASINANVQTADPLTGTVTSTVTAVPLSISLDLAGSTLFGTGFEASRSLQDGYTSGHLAGMNLQADGLLEGQFSNGQTLDLGRVALATFINPNGLQSIGNNLWLQTANSGAASVGSAGAGGRGQVDSYSLEASNVDLPAQLVDMITMQRNYQANAQSIKVQDEVLRTLSALR